MKSYRLHDFENSEQQRLWEALTQAAAQAEERLGSCVMVANYAIDGTLADALLVAPHGIIIFSLLGLHGTVRTHEDSPWSFGSRIVPAHGMSRTPYHAMRKHCAALSLLWGSDLAPFIHACVVLNDDTELENNLTSPTQAWLHCTTAQSLPATLASLASPATIPHDKIQAFATQLQHMTAWVEEWNTESYCNDAATLYAQLEELCRMNSPARDRYPALREVFHRAVELGISSSRLAFKGLFAKVDYLIKECRIDSRTAGLIHASRKTMEAAASLSDKAAEESFRHDVKAVVLLLSHLPKQPQPPASLVMLLPDEDRITQWGSIDLHVVRCSVESWDDEFIYATDQQVSSQLKVCYGAQNHYLTREGISSWDYLRELLSPGCVLNLVRVRMEDNVCLPELIIYEPDYLINISTVASCFETYDESPLVALVNTFKPHPNRSYIHLGNLAGEFLDHTVHGRKVAPEDCFAAFLRRNALSMTACPDLASPAQLETLKAEAGKQMEIIADLMAEGVATDVEQVVLEPSFFSEVLGLQGRMDLLYSQSEGRSTIVEQKSGKAAWGSTDEDVRVQEKHWVQVELYQALMIYEFRRYANQLSQRLLYSKYRNGLVAPGHSAQLLLRAIKLRNQLAWSEINYAEEGFGLLAKLTPEMLNRKGAKGSLWVNYVRPELDAVLSPLKSASATERAYFLRMAQFVQKEHCLAKLGSRRPEDSGFAGHWMDSLATKMATGSIYHGLTLSQCHEADGAVNGLVLLFPETMAADATNFRVGDIVMLYPYMDGQEPNPCAQMVTRAVLSRLDADRIELTLTHPQTNPKVFDLAEGYRWAVEHDMFESSTSALLRALHAFLTAPQERRNLLLGQRQPTVDTTLRTKGSYGKFDEMMTYAKQSRDIFLIIGPPGTGKTSFGMLNMLREELAEEGHEVLLLSYTNRAVDEMCGKLAEEGIDFVRIGSPLSCDKRYHDNLLERRVAEMTSTEEVRSLLAKTRVVCATTSTMNSHTELFALKHFDLAIVDEASQILEPHLVGLFAAQHSGRRAIDRWVLIGDHKQLPAVVQQTAEESMVTEPELLDIGLRNCRLSLFERMLSAFKTPEGYDPRFVYMLSHQGRMHEEIADFASRHFYGGRLQVVPLPHQTEACTAQEGDLTTKILTQHRTAFVASNKPQGTVTGKSNAIEAKIIAQLVVEIYRLNADHFAPEQTVGVIVPYRNQIALVRSMIDNYSIDVLHDIAIDTVERFQGSQRDYIIFGFTITEAYQLAFLTSNCFMEDGRVIDRKLNVAITRARMHLLLVGCPQVLRRNALFATLIDELKDKGAYYLFTDQ